jgi:hypothetical protein
MNNPRNERVNRNIAQLKSFKYPIAIEYVEGSGWRIVAIINGKKFYGTLSEAP